MMMADLMERLQTVVAAYGADRARWPAADREALSELAATNPEARRLLAGEASFDTLLAAASARAPEAAVARARDQLFARLESETPARGQDALIVPFARREAPRPAGAAPGRSMWREAALLAAALLIGVFTGTQGLLEGSGLDLTNLTTTAATASADSDDVSTLALDAESEDLNEEELL
jgi:hypothetical protein